jgi:hypothetical protein
MLGQGLAPPGSQQSEGSLGTTDDGLDGVRRALLVVPANVLHNAFKEVRAQRLDRGSERQAG